MTNGQTSYALVEEPDWTTTYDSASGGTLEDSWEHAPPAPFEAYSESTVSATGLVDLEMFSEIWSRASIEVNSSLQKSVYRLWTNTKTTSPWPLFLRNLDEQTPFENLLAYLHYGLSREDGDKLAERLCELRIDLLEDEGSPELSIRSVLGLIKFLRLNPSVSDPGLSVSSSGNIRAEWHQSWRQHFVCEFSSDTDARFVIFVQDPNVPTKTLRLSATCSIESVIEQALPHGIATWVIKS